VSSPPITTKNAPSSINNADRDIIEPPVSATRSFARTVEFIEQRACHAALGPELRELKAKAA